MKKKRNNRKPTLLADNLAAIYGQRKWDGPWRIYTLVRCWPKLVGSVFAEHSIPAYFRRNELWVYVENSIWMQQMHLGTPDILEKINAFLQSGLSVQDIRWKLLPADLIHPREEQYEPPPIEVDPAAERNFRAMAENIADPEARTALCNLWLRLESVKQKA